MERSIKMKKLVLLPILLLLWLFWMFQEAKKNVVKSEILPVTDLPESFSGRSIFFISDIHFRKIPGKLLQNIEKTPDFVIVGGDLTEKDVPLQNVLHNIRQLKKVAQVVFVWGNNDIEEQPEILRDLLQDEGVIILENECISWEVNNEKVEIAGISDQNQVVDDRFLSGNRSSDISILVTHDPAVLNKLSHLQSICAALTGHTHGGQIRLGPFGLREKGGWKVRRGIPLLISNGYGTTTLPLRWGAPAETHLITLKRKEEGAIKFYNQ